MFILSVGMQKSGSGLLFNLTNDLLVFGGKSDVRKVRELYKLDDLLKYHNCNMGELSPDKISRLLEIAKVEQTFVIKTHSGIQPHVLDLIKQGSIKATVIYRDPRDVVVSAMDHGKKIRENGENHSFASCTSIEITVETVKGWLSKSIIPWLQFPHPNILTMRYEDLTTHPVFELQRLCQFLGVDAGKEELLAVIAKYNSENLDEFMKDYLHFNEGKTGRFRNVLSVAEADYCNRAFENYFALMGYSS